MLFSWPPTHQYFFSGPMYKIAVAVEKEAIYGLTLISDT